MYRSSLIAGCRRVVYAMGIRQAGLAHGNRIMSMAFICGAVLLLLVGHVVSPQVFWAVLQIFSAPPYSHMIACEAGVAGLL